MPSVSYRMFATEPDRVIREVAGTIARINREVDELFRYGGEEFALLCPETLTGALALAERIRSEVANSPHAGLNQPVTISIGIATFPTHAEGFSELLRQADMALYQAKALGRNRTVAACATDA